MADIGNIFEFFIEIFEIITEMFIKNVKLRKKIIENTWITVYSMCSTVQPHGLYMNVLYMCLPDKSCSHTFFQFFVKSRRKLFVTLKNSFHLDHFYRFL